MTDPTPTPEPGTKGRLIVNIVLLILNLVICAYFLQQGRLLLLLLFAVLAVRNGYIVFTLWQARQG